MATKKAATKNVKKKASTSAKKTVVKKAPEKKAPAKNTSAIMASAKKTPAKKTPAKKAPAKKAPAKNTHATKAPVKKTQAAPSAAKMAPAQPKAPAKALKSTKAAPVKTGGAAVPATATVAPAKKVVLDKPFKTPFKKKELEQFRKLLLDLRDRVVDEITFLAGDNLSRNQRDTPGDISSYSYHMADQGTDNFDREFALNLVSSEQDILYEIEEALQRVDMGTYGVCEISGQPIEKARLKALPHARHSVKAQQELERGRSRFRPFGPTLSNH